MRWAILAILLTAAGCDRSTPRPGIVTSVGASGPAKITQFYAEPVVAKGETAKLCYGVENAKTVTLEPPVEKVWPSIARCIPVDPSKADLYKLTATGEDGNFVSQTLRIKVGAPRPKIIEVSINKTSITAGEMITYCYKAENGVSVDAGPGNWITSKSHDHGCLTHIPRMTTAYHVRINGRDGQFDTEQVTVLVRP